MLSSVSPSSCPEPRGAEPKLGVAERVGRRESGAERVGQRERGGERVGQRGWGRESGAESAVAVASSTQGKNHHGDVTCHCHAGRHRECGKPLRQAN